MRITTARCSHCGSIIRSDHPDLCVECKQPLSADAFESGPAYLGPVLTTSEQRLVAVLLDLTCYGIAMGPGLFAMYAFSPGLGRSLVMLGALAFSIYQVFLLSMQGQTIGKKLMGIRIVRYTDGSNPGFFRSVLLRAWVPNVVSVIPLVGLIDTLFIFGKERRCLHDYLAGTKVVEVSSKPDERASDARAEGGIDKYYFVCKTVGSGFICQTALSDIFRRLEAGDLRPDYVASESAGPSFVETMRLGEAVWVPLQTLIATARGSRNGELRPL